ncbi:DUF1700 domain-containing protein [Gehongia tenuis]|uniref:DUF1700 domain-containing protein n=1 Tax=Gehongia tenuis TaxID=2763655 RepID=A0A926D2W0_9FIRM|nr:DUF1700 domain-containing protein [Gehongia tenuis]MBC8530278.1 DUF1700 domain-containing protein [Gehongia tenuis]
MKEQYLAEVAKRLNVPRSKRKEILRDLSEAFASAAEHGESEEQVVRRLGTPQDFVDSLAPFSPSTRKRLAAAFGVTLVAAVTALIPWLVSRMDTVPKNAIGQADAATSIQLESALPIDAPTLFLIASLLLFAGAALLAVKLWRMKGRS